ncbi:MAG: ABC transporter substrate-binding protein [Deltaproteobacteria bacterium]|nr:ABC transporter substrate-binding protein [Deltaproteobacteria bacterium]
MTRWLRILAPLALGLLGGCDVLLDLQPREYVPQVAPCTTSLDCAPGLFCSDGTCGAAVPGVVPVGCTVLEPSETTVEAFDWSKHHHIIGLLARTQNVGERPRVQAMRLAVRQINQAGGVRPSQGPSEPVALVACDYGGDVGTAAGMEADAAIVGGIDFLAKQLGARAVLAAASTSATNTALQQIMTTDLPVALVSAFSTSPTLTDANDKPVGAKTGLLWRTSPDDTVQAKALARLIDDVPDAKRAVILFVNDDYGSALQEDVSVELGNLKNKVPTLPASFEPSATIADFKAKLAQLVASTPSPDVLLFVGIDGQMAARAFTALVEGNHTGAFKRLLLADAAKDQKTLLDPTLPAEVKAVIAQALGTAPYRSEAPHYNTFRLALDNTFGVNADNFSFVAQSYDAAYLAGYGLTWAGAAGTAFSGLDVAEGFSNLSAGQDVKVGSNNWNAATLALIDLAADPRSIDIDGTSGPLDFDANGQALGPIEVWRPTSDFAGFESCAICFKAEAECNVSTCN